MEVLSYLNQGFPQLQGIDSLCQMILCSGGCPELCQMLSILPGLCPLDASSSPSCDKPKMSADTAKCLRGKTAPG